MTFKYRHHRGSLSASMETSQEFESKEKLISFLKSIWPFNLSELKDADVEVIEYGYDDRINWDTHAVSINGFGVVGFTNKQI